MPSPPAANPHVRARAALARRLAPAWAADPEVAAVAISGSTARGLADARSDLELGVYWRRPPTDDQRQRAVDARGAAVTRRFTRGEDPGRWFGVDNLQLGGFGVDVAMNTVAADAAVEHALTGSDLRAHELGAMLAELVPLRGEALVAGWRARLVYPDRLRAAMLERHLRLTPGAGCSSTCTGATACATPSGWSSGSGRCSSPSSL